MDKILPVAIIAVILVTVFLAMRLSWLKRTRRDAGLAGYEAPAHPGAALARVDGFYVATTALDRPLERLAVRSLAFRGRAAVDVNESGLTITVTGEESVHIPAGALLGVQVATATIDRVVERGGLIRLSWRTVAPGADVDSYFRIVDPVAHDRLLDAISGILPQVPGNAAALKGDLHD